MVVDSPFSTFFTFFTVSQQYFVLQGTPGKSAETEELLLHPGGDAVPRTVVDVVDHPNGSQKMGKHPGTRMVP